MNRKTLLTTAILLAAVLSIFALCFALRPGGTQTPAPAGTTEAPPKTDAATDAPSGTFTDPPETDAAETFPRETEPPETEPPVTDPPPPADGEFVRVLDYIPDLIVDLKYATEDNFTGGVVYESAVPYLRYGTVKKLAAAQAEFASMGLSLKLWDAYRPAAAQFILWNAFPNSKYISNPYRGYSGHTRGDTVDVTLVKADGTEIPMPSGFDEFSPLANRNYDDVSEEAAKNSQLLEKIMLKYGFNGYPYEWWHYSDAVRYPTVDFIEGSEE